MKKIKILMTTALLTTAAGLSIYPVFTAQAAYYNSYWYESSVTGGDVYLPQPKSTSCPLPNEFIYKGRKLVEFPPMCFVIAHP